MIARLNIGGPAIQAITLTKVLEKRGYATHLVRGSEDADEGSMDELAARLGVQTTLISEMRRDPGTGDLRALWQLVRILRRDRPQIVHTHAAKAGTLGRLATLVAFPRRRPVVVHTFHGHSLSGYFSSRTARLYRTIERLLAHMTDVLVAVSPEVRDDLVAMRVAPAGRFVVTPLGLDLSGFTTDERRSERRVKLRRDWGLAPDHEVVTLVARLVPIKRVDRFLRVALLLAGRPAARFVVVGDGELREQLVNSAEARQLGDRLVWAGFRADMADVYYASDVVVLTSDNEGTPVSLIEAQAAAVPVIGTAVGGVPSAVKDGQSGFLAARNDETALATAVQTVLDDDELSARFGEAGRRHVERSFALELLVDDLDALYRGLIATKQR